MTSKWEVDTAIQDSNMAPNARLIMFVLISAADPETAVIPDRFTPSLEEIAGRSGLSKSAVAEWLTVLEDSGWVKRDRPSITESFVGGRRTRYQLAIGDQLGSPKPKRERKRRPEITKSSENDTDSTVRTADSPHGGQPNPPEGPHGGQSAVRTADSHGPHGGHKSSPSQQAHLPPTGGDADAPPPDALFDLEDDRESEQPAVDDAPKSNVVLAEWIDHCTAHGIKLPKDVKGHYARKIADLLDQGIEPELIRDALIRMRGRGFAGSPSKLGEFLVDVQNQRSASQSRSATGSARVSSKASVKKWKKDQ